ncbi:hypothetical protein [Rhodoferax sp. GW822-FHT02A01]|uniref:hypothetical protein n=1 Tax=Rhodoferax sp. GW822-FHT02A01 TaxID=3141537 RepID=UPI00315DDEC3
MDKRLESAAIIAAALLREYRQPTTEKIVELLVQSLHAVDEAVSAENKRSAQKHAALKSNTVIVRR